MRTIIRTISMVTAVAAFGAALLTATPASAATVASAASQSATSASPATAPQAIQVYEFDAKLTPQQLDQLRLAAKSAADNDMGIMAQGGFDRDHWWIKVSTAEIISVGAAVVCRAVFGGASWFICPPLTAAINWALQQWPNAGGFWAELYTNGRVRVGTW